MPVVHSANHRILAVSAERNAENSYVTCQRGRVGGFFSSPPPPPPFFFCVCVCNNDWISTSFTVICRPRRCTASTFSVRVPSLAKFSCETQSPLTQRLAPYTYILYIRPRVRQYSVAYLTYTHHGAVSQWTAFRKRVGWPAAVELLKRAPLCGDKHSLFWMGPAALSSLSKGIVSWSPTLAGSPRERAPPVTGAPGDPHPNWRWDLSDLNPMSYLGRPPLSCAIHRRPRCISSDVVCCLHAAVDGQRKASCPLPRHHASIFSAPRSDVDP
ncbi:hypothetical protein LY76DRAFT_387409 [Colletotrichum caudatum]|nr:hypothetical protein LY76DRAFT_387409 [Colletotrichum caudatum]